MKKIKITGAAVVGLSAVIALVPSVAYAADGTGTITYEGKNTTTDPTDPENSGKPTTLVNPEDPDSPNPPTGENGPLSIDYISPLRFGNQQTTSNVGTYNKRLYCILKFRNLH